MRRILLAALCLVAFRALGQSSSILTAVESPSSGTNFDKYPSVVFDRNGGMWLAWTSTRKEGDVIVVRGAGAEERIDGGEGIESGARLIMDGRDALRVIWHGRRDGQWSIFTRSRTGNRWSAEEKIADGLHPAITRDRRGRLWVAYEVPKAGGFAVELIAQSGRGWSAPSRIESAGSDRRPALAPAAEGGVWIAWDSTRTANYDIFLARTDMPAASRRAPRIVEQLQVTRHATIDDSPSIATTRNGDVWIAWNGMRSHAKDLYRADRHSGDAFVRIYRKGHLLTPTALPSALPGQVSIGAVNKTPRDAVDPYWHWKQTQNYPIVFVEGDDRAWIIWRTDATGAHNFDLWARIHDGERWSRELHLTTFSPGRDEWPAAALRPDGRIQLAWEGQRLPRPGEELPAGDVDAYNTLGMPNVILTATATSPFQGWEAAPLLPAPEEKFIAAEMGEPITPGPPPRTSASTDGPWRIYFGDPHSHTILSDGKTGLPDQLLSLSRDHLGLDFAVVSDHTEMGHLQASEYAELQLTAAIFNQPGRFVSLTGWEWTAGVRYGHRVILYRDQGGTPVSAAHPEGDSIEKLYEHVRKDHGVMSPHHTGNATWGRWNPDAPHQEALEPNFEICSWHGRYEFYGNPWEGRRQVPGHQYQDALRRGRHVGVMGASDTHHLSPGEGGLTAVLAERLDRASIFAAISNRRNYATTGARIVLEFEAAGAPMGSRITHSGSLDLRVRVEGTAPIDRVEIVRNLVDTFAAVRIEQNSDGLGGVFLIYEPREPQGGRRLALDDMRKLSFTVTDTDQPSAETSYYVRVTQADGHQAWSSPIWVSR